MTGYDHQEIEARWQRNWAKQRVAEVDLSQPQSGYYMLTMFPYPSGDRLHVGHGRNYIPGDVVFRFLRMQGRRVLNPMGWDSFGLPAENAAIERGVHPRDWTLENIRVMKEQFQSWGVLFDWSKEIATCEPEYFRWNQWLFLKMLERGLAYRKRAPVNWCPSCRTVLANEQVVDGVCERCGTTVQQRELEQWFYRITEYAERLLEGLGGLETWPERVRVMQRNWIGRSEGAALRFPLLGHEGEIEVFTTRPDTVHGATFMVMAVDHPLVPELIRDHPEARELEEWIQIVRNRPRSEREGEGAKEGRDTGCLARNPATGEAIPIWLADYVLSDYGTGAIMAVPAHDQRDFDFARAHGLEIRYVYQPEEETEIDDLTEARPHEGVIRGIEGFEGRRASEETTAAFIEWIESSGWGEQRVNYRLRDWLISRQRYWGTPIPVVYCDDCGVVPMDEDELPVELPYEVQFSRREGNPLARVKEFVETSCPGCGGPARRETDTMDTFVDSSWYYLRYLSAHDDKQIFDPEVAAEWAPVDQYIGGIEHAILHLLYARFICMVLHDFGLVEFQEPFLRLFNQGMITRFAEESGRVEKMSKSRGNTVSPDELIGEMGADTQRVYTLFMGPPEDEVEWNDEAVAGAWRFLNRVWHLHAKLEEAPSAGIADAVLERIRHQMVARVTHDLQKFKFNTAVAALMEYSAAIRQAVEERSTSRSMCETAYDTLLQLLHPMAPHLTDELWHRRGHLEMLLDSSWPRYDEEWLEEENVTIVVQVDGKLREQLEVPVGTAETQIEELALSSDRVQSHLAGRELMRSIHVPDRLVNLVTQTEDS